MSGIITSFFIEPVVRQARRLSSAARASNAEATPAATSDREREEDAECGKSASSDGKIIKNKNGTGNQRARASSQDLDESQLVAESHVNNVAAASCSCSPQNSPSTPATAFDSSSAAAAAIHDLPTSPCAISPTTTTASRRLSLPLGQALFDRFVPLVSDRNISSSSQSHTARTTAPANKDYFADTPQSGTDNSSPRKRESSHITRPEPDVTPSNCVQMERRGTRGLCPPGLDTPTREAIEDEMTRRIYQSTVLGRGEVRRRRESVRETAEALADAMKDKGNATTIVDEAEIRRKIQQIWAQPVSTEDKSRAMHLVMNEKYLARVEEKQRQRAADLITSPTRLDSSSSLNSLRSGSLSTGDLELYTRYNIVPDDLIPTHRPIPTEETALSRQRRSSSNLASLAVPTPMSRLDDDEDDADDRPDLGCEHYKRNIKIQCFDCKTWWNCRYCHDNAETGHILPRQATENMLCMLCQTPGPAGQYCQHCGEQAAYYYCDICKLWDDDAVKNIYHCADCGICRIGTGLGKDFKHCKRCNVCIPITQYDWHKCLERATECDCPICGDYLFTSLTPIVSMPCGHYLHQTCYNEYMVDAYQCPVCKKSAKNMASQWRKLEEEIGRQPMPTNLRNISVDVRCNDCAGRSRVPFHWLGNKCELCDSYNTVEIELHRDGHASGNSPSPPRGNWRTGRSIPRARAQRYFQDDEEQTNTNGAADAAETSAAESLLALPNTAYEILSNQIAAMRRNLSPIRRYLNAVEESPNGATEAEIERMGFWQYGSSPRSENVVSNRENHIENVEEWEDEDEEGDDEDDDISSGSSDRVLFDDDSDSSSDDDLDIRLIGHR